MPIEPVALGITVKDVLQAVAGWVKETAAKKAHQDEALRTWGAILFESRINAERVRLMVEGAKANRTYFAPFDFSVSDAALPAFVLASKLPLLLAEVQTLLSALKRIDFFQRNGAAEPLRSSKVVINGAYIGEISTPSPALQLAVGFAKDFFEKKHPQRFNGLLELADGFGRETHQGSWESLRGSYLPDPIDTNSAVDHSRI